jgi:hypothetical protein
MIGKALAVAGLLMMPVGVSAQALWNNTTVGMSKAQVKALYPKNVVELGDGCFADLDFDYEKGGLQQVSLEWSAKDRNKRCADVVVQSLFAKYGKPKLEDREVQLTDCGNPYAGGVAGFLAAFCDAAGGDEPRYYNYSRWFIDGIEITLKLNSASETEWWLVYRLAVGPSKDAASKL